MRPPTYSPTPEVRRRIAEQLAARRVSIFAAADHVDAALHAPPPIAGAMPEVRSSFDLKPPPNFAEEIDDGCEDP